MTFQATLAHFCHILDWRFFFKSLAISIQFNHILYALAVNLICWRASFEISILLFDYFLGLKSDISGLFGTLLPHIGAFFLSHLPYQFGRNLFIFCMFLHSISHPGEEILNSLSFCLLFFLVQRVPVLAVLTHV